MATQRNGRYTLGAQIAAQATQIDDMRVTLACIEGKLDKLAQTPLSKLTGFDRLLAALYRHSELFPKPS